jgi:hypothetical protein
VCVGMLCRDSGRATQYCFYASLHKSHFLTMSNLYTIHKWRCVLCLRNKKVFVNEQVTMSPKSMVCRDVLNYGMCCRESPSCGK